MKNDTRKVVSVMSFNSVMEAQLYKALLESAGVETRMQNDLAAQVMPAFGSLMQVNLLVAEEDQRKAREIIGAKFDIDEFHRQAGASKKEPTGTELAKEAHKLRMAEKKAAVVSKDAEKKTSAATAKKKSAGGTSKKVSPRATARKVGAAQKLS